MDFFVVVVKLRAGCVGYAVDGAEEERYGAGRGWGGGECWCLLVVVTV